MDHFSQIHMAENVGSVNSVGMKKVAEWMSKSQPEMNTLSGVNNSFINLLMQQEFIDHQMC